MKPCINHKWSNSCKKCEHRHNKSKHKCKYPTILVDTSVILQTLEQEDLEKADTFIQYHRRGYRVGINHIILGEVITRWAELKNDTRDQLSELQYTSWLNRYLPIMNTFDIVEIPYYNDDFAKIQDILQKVCHCGPRDRLIIAIAIYQKTPFFFFDAQVYKDAKSINREINKAFNGRYKFEMYPHSR